MDGDLYLPFVENFLESKDDRVRVSAAVAIGESGHKKALETLRSCWKQTADLDFKRDLLVAISLLRSEHAIQFLLSLIEDAEDSAADAWAAASPWGLWVCLRDFRLSFRNCEWHRDQRQPRSTRSGRLGRQRRRRTRGRSLRRRRHRFLSEIGDRPQRCFGGNAGSAGTGGAGIGGGLYIDSSATVTVFPDTFIGFNFASTSNDNVFGSFMT